MKRHHLSHKGFTLIELLVVIAIIALLSSIVIATLSSTRAKGRDADRVSSFKELKNALELYYEDNGHYPPACGSGYYGFTYASKQSDGSCSGYIGLRFDNSTSDGFLDRLYPDYLNQEGWTDPLRVSGHDNPHNCRYVIPRTPPGCNVGNKTVCDATCQPQKYYLHCLMETTTFAARNDGGVLDDVYEVWSGTPWVCLTGLP